MRRFTMPVFDNFISGTTSIWYTSSAYNDVLGSADDLLVQAVTEQVSGTTNVTIQPEHSCNALDWIAFPGNLVANAVVSDGTYLAESAFFNGAVLLTFVRLKITLTGTTPACRLKVLVCGRATTSDVTPVSTPQYGHPAPATSAATLPASAVREFSRLQWQPSR